MHRLLSLSQTFTNSASESTCIFSSCAGGEISHDFAEIQFRRNLLVQLSCGHQGHPSRSRGLNESMRARMERRLSVFFPPYTIQCKRLFHGVQQFLLLEMVW